DKADVLLTNVRFWGKADALVQCPSRQLLTQSGHRLCYTEFTLPRVFRRTPLAPRQTIIAASLGN
ncbi:MAG: hypothetical protein OEU26_11665, partial [Candidatus Tectomicrobia bacterium]|nr:hypothetical protein [Candidatus Tectomicrobia bacterium]